MTNEDRDKKEYELALLLKGEEDLADVRTLLATHNAAGVSEPRAKRLQFAYEVKGCVDGIFASLTFTMDGSDAKELEHELAIRPSVLRSMIIASPAPSERTAASPLPAREERRPRTVSGETSKPAAPRPLSNEALEKKIEEILQ